MGNITYDIMLLEADRIVAERRKDFDLYVKDRYGNFEVIGEAYDEKVQEMIDGILKRKKMKYYLTFNEGLDIMDTLTPSANKILRFFTKSMGYGNMIRNISIRDINKLTSVNSKFTQMAISSLLANDIIRFETVKNRRNYMVNPAYFYKGSMKKIFMYVCQYNKMESIAHDGSVQFNPLEDEGL